MGAVTFPHFELQVEVLRAPKEIVHASVGRQESNQGLGCSFVDVVQAAEDGSSTRLPVDRPTARDRSLKTKR